MRRCERFGFHSFTCQAFFFLFLLFGRFLYRKYEPWGVGYVYIHMGSIYQGRICICMLLSTRNESLLEGEDGRGRGGF